MLQTEIQPTILKMLVEDVPRNLARFDPTSGRFLTEGGWAVTNQDIVYPLALLYTTNHPENPYYRDQELLAVIGRAGDAWREFQYPDGQVEFIKIDDSTWGPIFMPWSMYHWVETYGLLRDELDPARRQRWEAGLTLAYDGITQQLASGRVHNIPTWNGMGSFRAGQLFGRTDWQEAGRRMIHLAVADQEPAGYWKEHGGPTTLYNLVYLHAIGLYYFFSQDESVLATLQRAVDFHIRYSYPDGRLVETIDGRVRYHEHVPHWAYSAFSLFPAGRSFVASLLANLLAERAAHPEPTITYIVTNGQRKPSSANFGLSVHLASALAHYQVGETAPIPQENGNYHIHDAGISLIRRQDGWFTCLSGFMVPPVETRWGLDRQAFASVWHAKTGLIIGGGNAKDQPDFSNFVVTTADGTLRALPDTARLETTVTQDRTLLTYAGQECTLSVMPQSATRLVLQLTAPNPATTRAQLMFRLKVGDTLRTATGDSYPINETALSLTAEAVGGSITYGGGAAFIAPRQHFHLAGGSL